MVGPRCLVHLSRPRLYAGRAVGRNHDHRHPRRTDYRRSILRPDRRNKCGHLYGSKSIADGLLDYKAKFNEVPPDFAGINDGTYGLAAKSAVLRHLSKAFPRFVIPGSTVNDKWNNLRDNIVGPNWGVNIDNLSPATAIVFWLGGKPVWKVDASNNPILPGAAGYDPMQPVQGFAGFSANQTNPFDNNASRIKPFLDIDPNMLNDHDVNGCFGYWPKNSEGTKTSGAFVYFRAENGNYTMDGLPAVVGLNNVKRYPDTATEAVWPAIDKPLSNPSATNYVWMNKESMQIFSSGLDHNYGLYSAPLCFPTGDNYLEPTYDDITNFSGGKTLEHAIP